MDFYEAYLARYLEAEPSVRAASKEHWLKNHKANLKSKVHEQVIFSAQILAMIALGDSILAEKVKGESA